MLIYYVYRDLYIWHDIVVTSRSVTQSIPRRLSVFGLAVIPLRSVFMEQQKEKVCVMDVLALAWVLIYCLI